MSTPDYAETERDISRLLAQLPPERELLLALASLRSAVDALDADGVDPTWRQIVGDHVSGFAAELLRMLGALGVFGRGASS